MRATMERRQVAVVLTLCLLSCSTPLPATHSPARSAEQADGAPRDGAEQAADGVLRFVVLGDGGTGDANQRRVARAVRDVCARRGCEFALYLGDNIYETGAQGVDDAQFLTKFEKPFAPLDFPFYVVLGNHDYGGGTPLGGGPDNPRVRAQIEYAAHSNKWKMPDRFYSFERGPAAFFALDTGALVLDVRGSAQAQQVWLDQRVAESHAPWKIAFGHHPYISNGYHGNAGNYEGSRGTQSSAYPTGASFAALVEHSMCGKVQVYFAGHDHDREWLEPKCGTQFIVSGAAAKLRPLASRDHQPTRYRDDRKRGFLWVELDSEQLTGVFYDDHAQVDFEATLQRRDL
jgi:hypothetical protein